MSIIMQVRSDAYRAARSISCSSFSARARRLSVPVSGSVDARCLSSSWSDIACSSSYARSSERTAAEITWSANWTSCWLSGRSSSVVRRKKTPAGSSRRLKRIAMAERQGMGRPSDSHSERIAS